MNAFSTRPWRALVATAAWLALPALAQSSADNAGNAGSRAPSQATWQQCTRLGDDPAARLACFDRWAEQQSLPATAADAPPALASAQPPGVPSTSVAAPVEARAPAIPLIEASGTACRDRRYSTLSRYWELEAGSDCGTFTFRGYRPLFVGIAAAGDTPDTPTSPAPGHDGTAAHHKAHEMRIGLSVRTKLAQGLLTQGDPARKDSVWFAYSQQSNWQVFNGDLSRPFRTTDHEPELMYVYPTDLRLPGGWRWRYAGVGIVHQSNGQGLPLSRSWNRLYLMGGMELDKRFTLTARVWKRLPENAADDDNPDITHYLGHSEITGTWYANPTDTLALTVRGALGGTGRGGARLEWLRAIGNPATSNLRWHTQLYHGYGDTLIDYNRKRTVLSVGVSLVDF